jgi:decaprenyl-phosphate phosphoribosyltransferase
VTTRARAAEQPPGGSAVTAHSPVPVRWLAAVVQTSRPRQWPKNLLVFAAPLAAASLGRDDGLGYALVAAVVFTMAAAAE